MLYRGPELVAVCHEQRRRAVAAAASGSNATPAMLGKLWQPAQLDSLRQADQERYKAGQPNLLDTIPAAIPL